MSGKSSRGGSHAAGYRAWEPGLLVSRQKRVSANGLQLPKELVERWGAKEGQEVIIELTHSLIRIVPTELDAAEIADRAATYVFDQVAMRQRSDSPNEWGSSGECRSCCHIARSNWGC